MNLADVPPELRARAIALALAELLRGSWYAPATARASAPLRVGANAEVLSPTAARPEHDTGRAQPPAAEDAAEANAGGQLRAAAEADATAEAGAGATHDAGESPPPTAARPLPDEPESPLRPARTSPAVSLGPALRLFAQRTTLLYGARASFRGFDCELGSAVSLANRRDPLGTLHFGVAQVFAAYDVVRIHAGDYGFIASPRLAIGFSWGTAQATVTSDAASAIDLVWDVAAQLLLSRALDERWTLALVIASGYARGPRYDAEREQVSLAGLFADAALSVLWQFGD